MSSPVSVIDPRSHSQDVIALAARILSRSRARQEVFKFVYRGKKRRETMGEILAASSSPRKTVYKAAKNLSKNHLIHEVMDGAQLAYEKEGFLDANKDKILSLASSPAKLANFPTSSNPQGRGTSTVVLRIPAKLVRVVEVSPSDVDEFSRVRKLDSGRSSAPRLREERIRRGFKRILGERGRFRDWPGEYNDLFTRVSLRGRRVSAAFAFKGRATQGKLTPRQMGKNADQIQRLFNSPASVFFVQYGGQISESVLEQMRIAATAKSYSVGQPVYYGVIDGAETARLVASYPDAFR